uniref:Thioredoxin domain-containing protein n=1 Tax=Phaeocystis antarctica TaxID=33657 RepID=A0A7S0EQ51_9EUKA|mmetsp:Transcript_22475/g.53853  ORF Transcript_22475/g.53853 Transcript_22475/m.53853 type:complete len:171 (-) Transcript_22475:201-713(-)
MKPAWDSLAQQFATSDKVLIGDVDCTASGKDLCERIGVEGFPTIKFFNPPDTDGEDYDGGRDEEALVEFAKTLGPGCSASTLENCSAEQKAEIEALLKLPEADLAKQLEELKATLAEKEKTHEKFVEGLQASYETSNKELEAFKKEAKPKMKLLRSAMPAKAADAGKDEV